MILNNKPETPAKGTAQLTTSNGHHPVSERPKPMVPSLRTVETKMKSMKHAAKEAPLPPSEDAERAERIRDTARTFIMPVVALAFICLIWEIYSSGEGIVLPGPIKTVTDSWYRIAHPWFDHGPNDKGLGWQLLYSLQRVGLGYSLAAVIGVLLGIIIGKSTMAFNALDPILQVLRTIPPPGLAGHRGRRDADRRRGHRFLNLGFLELVPDERHHRIGILRGHDRPGPGSHRGESGFPVRNERGLR